VAGSLARRMLLGITVRKTSSAKKLPQVVGDLAGEVGAVIVHGEQDAFDGQRGVEGIADMIDGIHEFGDAFEGEELALDGDQDGVGGD